MVLYGNVRLDHLEKLEKGRGKLKKREVGRGENFSSFGSNTNGHCLREESSVGLLRGSFAYVEAVGYPRGKEGGREEKERA